MFYTTLSSPLQSFMETQMDAFLQKVKGKYMTATLVSAKTGEILATTQRPTLMQILKKESLRTLFGVIFFIKVTTNQDQP